MESQYCLLVDCPTASLNRIRRLPHASATVPQRSLKQTNKPESVTVAGAQARANVRVERSELGHVFAGASEGATSSTAAGTCRSSRLTLANHPCGLSTGRRPASLSMSCRTLLMTFRLATRSSCIALPPFHGTASSAAAAFSVVHQLADE